ncbi:MAG: acyl-coenzyme A synthetase/AMP-(fatty) acid ligase [Chitinophagales bacterium]|jgi:acyl-coenzyme A synthetase/AMP-(fatty) acid ligase
MHVDRTWWQQPFDDNWTIAALLEKESSRHSHRPALVTQDGKYTTHGQISDTAKIIQQWLFTNSNRGDCVATLLEFSPEYYASIYAIFSSNLVYATLDPEAQEQRNAHHVKTARIKLILADENYMPHAMSLARANPSILVIDIQLVIKSLPAKHNEIIEIKPSDIVANIATSGTLGAPKIVVRTHLSYAHAVYSLAIAESDTPEDMILAMGSPAHVGFINHVLMCLIGGHCSLPIALNNFSVSKIISLITTFPITSIDFSPAILRLILPELEKKVDQLALRQIFVSGSPILDVDVNSFTKAFGSSIHLLQNYGSTETGPIISSDYIGEYFDTRRSLPMRNLAHDCQIDIVDEIGKTVPNNIEGEFVIQSRYMAIGYLGATQKENEKFHTKNNNKRFSIGDRGYRNDQGEIFILGRSDRQVSINGRRLELGDIESAIRALPAWDDAVVNYHQDFHPPRLIALVQPKSPHQKNIIELKKSLTFALPPTSIPSHYIVSDIPKTLSGKTDHAKAFSLTKESDGGIPKGIGGFPKGKLELFLAECWAEIFNCNLPRRNDTFISLGGDSLMATQLILMIEQRFINLTLTLDSLATAQTITQQAKLIQYKDHDNKTSDTLTRMKKSSSGPTVILIPGLGCQSWIFNHLANAITANVTIYGLSISSIFQEKNHNIKTKPALIEKICQSIEGLDTKTPLIVLGYSKGGIIAIDVINSLRGKNVNVERLILLDTSLTHYSKMFALLKTWKKSIFGSSIMNLNRGKAQKRFDQEIIKNSNIIEKMYAGRFALEFPSIKTSLLQTNTQKQPIPNALMKNIKSKHIKLIPSGHQEFLRPPRVIETAEWLDRELETCL